MMNPKSHLLALRLIQNAQDYLQALINQAQLSRLQQEVWEDALADGVGDDLVGLFCPPAPEVKSACQICGRPTSGCCTVQDAREVSLEEAEEIAREDASLIWCEVEK